MVKALLIIAAIIVCACVGFAVYVWNEVFREPPGISKEPVEISGEFFADGTCTMTANGIPLFSPADSARTTHKFQTASIDGYYDHFITCSPVWMRNKRPQPDFEAGRSFMLIFSVKENAAPHIGRYTILKNAAAGHATAAMDAGYSDPKHFGIGAPGSGRPGDHGKVTLECVSGTAVVTAIGPTGVVGTVQYRAVRKWDWWM